MEPDNCTGWHWITWEEMENIGMAQMEARARGGDAEQELPERLFEPIISLLRQRPGVQPC
jgi:hypothetical protein